MTVTEFIQEKFPITKGRMNQDIINNVSGDELAELINDYLTSEEKNAVLSDVISCPSCGSKHTEPSEENWNRHCLNCDDHFN